MRDIVRAQCALVKHFGVRELAMVAGGSIGGQQALEWAVTYPEMVRKGRGYRRYSRFNCSGHRL